jgi:hypothetical protein
MASTSELTFGSRLANANTLVTHLQSFTDYAAQTPDQSTASMQALIAEITAQNKTTAGDKQDYSTAIDLRRKVFQKDEDCLIKLLSPIGSAVRSALGKTSKEAANIAALITKIRGIKPKKEPKEPTEETVSQSERSFGSITQNFSDIIATLEKFGANYNPANKKVTLPALTDKLARLTEANTNVPVTFGRLKKSRDDRNELYKKLTDITQRIKDAVKSQYTLGSSEYALIKALKI